MRVDQQLPGALAAQTGGAVILDTDCAHRRGGGTALGRRGRRRRVVADLDGLAGRD